MPLIETPEQATRLARANCSAVSLYNEEKIIRGGEPGGNLACRPAAEAVRAGKGAARRVLEIVD